MKILYGVVGEGMGHAMRSRVILDALIQRHQVHVVVSGRAYDYLEKRVSHHLAVTQIWGYSLVYEDNEVQSFRTFLENAKGAITGWPKNVRAYFDIAEKFQPDVVISDFETWSHLYAKLNGVPLVCVDNIQMVSRCTHAPEILAGHESEFRLAKALVKTKVPGALHYLITTFFYPPVRKERTTLHPPVLRPEILTAQSVPGDHLVVYQSSTSNTGLADALKTLGRECRIYGMRRDIQAELVDGPLRHRPFSERGFIDDLRTAYGVISSAGFTLMGEAVYLHKPMIALPLNGQFEQILNARYLEAEGYGLCAETLDAGRLGEFVERIPEFTRKLASYSQDGNRDLLDKLEAVLAQAAA